MPKDSLRDYGYGDPGTPLGKPTWIPAEDIGDKKAECPNCGARLCEITVQMKSHKLTGGIGVGIYCGCPACRFASPMLMRATPGATPQPPFKPES